MSRADSAIPKDESEEGSYSTIFKNEVIVKLFVITFASFTAKSIYNGAVFSAYIFLLMNRQNMAVGFLAGMSGLIGMIMAPIVGIISDKWDRTQFLRSSAFFGFVAVVVAAYAVSKNSYTLILGSEIVWGFFWAIFTPTCDTLVADYTEEGQRSKYYTVTQGLKNITGAMGPLTALALFLNFGNVWDIAICRKVMYVGLGLFIIPLTMLVFFKTGDRSSSPSQGEYGSVSQTEDVEGQDDKMLEMSSHLKSVFSETEVSNESVEIDSLVEMREREFAEINQSLEAGSGGVQSRAHYIYGDILLVPAAVAMGDVITGLASGMTIKFMPIFMLDLLNLSPDKVQIVYTASPLMIVGATIVVQRLSKTLGRAWATVLAKSIGTSLLLLLSYQAHLYILHSQEWAKGHSDHPWYCSVPAILAVFLIRTVIMNTTKPLTRSIIMDAVPKQQRGRWQGLESINAATWAGSAVVGGILIDRYGYVGIFVTTAIMQICSMLPIIWIASLVPAE